MEKANLQLAFKAWAVPRGYDLTETCYGDFLHLETRSAWLGFEAAHGEAGCRPAGQQLYARIKKTSKYAHQTDKLFPVRVGKAPYDNFVVHGGPGGLYALRDVSFYVLVDDKPMRLT
ncbi:hypothetical protein PHLH8_56720 [Pseudomonas sp. Pc102]|uniref:hypothetical protein n=1 Tax=Pseudomonas sp. Pc102 TaxID=2678261 RepID=UPI001BD01262|nr:hypothetical protein [Pseudomonas sp. Pc102]BBP86030.1 hypothetical protein PHLH8_56720 [Pseudomonas sp. Pc102]